jgi:glycosyltransferase involved in cell wall biosynthesis
MRIALRRISARRIRHLYSSSWPIDLAAIQPPKSWAGWPDGKKFAFVLTHDVEDIDGLAKCRQLAELELQFGVRSSFNFVPEGRYSVPSELRHWLVKNGFEVGVHDLNHDGKLFSSRSGFSRKAERINDYAHDWNAAGFRAGFMLRKLDWMHELAIEYDASTFDTDPFELQAEGAGTIFPYWIPQDSAHGIGSGYVELPYTLPQDSTLFLVLREATNEIWVRKTDWIAAHGGMALVNVHPDYVSFNGRRTVREYSIDQYADLLRYVTTSYRHHFWNPAPKDLARWFRQSQGHPPPSEQRPHVRDRLHHDLRGKRAAVLLYSTYPADPRPRRATETLIEAGMNVDLLCLAESPGDRLHEIVGGVNVVRLPMQHRRDSKIAYFWQYGRFLLNGFWFLLRGRMRHRYDLVHVHNMPDVLAFSALVPKLTGAKVVLDLHDPMPELMMTIFGTRERSFGIWSIKRLEGASIWFSDAVITVNEACRKLFSARCRNPGKINVVMNAPDEKIFAFVDATDPAPVRHNRRFAIMYHGSLVERHGLDLAVLALAQIKPDIPDSELWIFGQETPFLRKVLASVQNGPLQDAIRYFGPKKLEDIASAIRECDVGIIPNRRSIFTEINTPTRIFEYLSQGKPVIAPRAPGILDYFGPDDLVYFELGDASDLANQIRYVHRNPDAVRETTIRGQRVYQNHSWSSEKARFLAVVARLLGAKERRGMSAPAPFATATTFDR